MKVGLISHSIYSSNLGCSALAISNIKLMDDVFRSYSEKVEYVVILPASGEHRDVKSITSLEGYTANPFSYAEYPRPKSLLAKPWLIKTTNAFNGCDCVVDLCGGDGYTDNYGVKRIFAESIPVFGCYFNGIKVFFGPQTIGPFNTKIGKTVAKATLKKLDTIFTRDESSYDCCIRMGFGKTTKMVTDVAFALPYEKLSFDNGKFNVGINVSGLLFNGGYNYDNYFGLSFSYKDFVCRLIELLLKESDTKVHLVPHVLYKNPDVDDDYSVCKKLKERYPELVLPDRFITASQAKSYISGMDLFTGARMHSTIGATSSGVPVIPIAYSRKFNGLYDTLGYKYYIDAKSNITLEEALQKFSEYRSNLGEMRTALTKAKEVYTANLMKYQELLAVVFNLSK